MIWRRISPAKSLAVAALLVLAVLYLFPFYWMVVTAIKPLSAFYRFPPTLLPEQATLASFASVMVRRGFAVLLRNSLVVCLAGAGLGLAVAMLIAYPVTRMAVPPGFRRGLLNWILSLRFLPPIVVVIPFFDIVRQVGLYDSLLSLVLLYAVFSLPFATWMLKGFLLEIPREIEEAALVDGATRWYAFFRVLLPQLAPALLATAVITFALAWSEFMFAFILTATPRSQTFPIGVASLVTQFEIIWNEMAAVGAIAAAVPILLLLCARRHVITALTFGAVREKA